MLREAREQLGAHQGWLAARRAAVEEADAQLDNAFVGLMSAVAVEKLREPA
jgi:hypothetical protein